MPKTSTAHNTKAATARMGAASRKGGAKASGKGAAGKVPPAPTLTPNRGAKAGASDVGASAYVPGLGAHRMSDTVLSENARSNKTHTVKVGPYTITKQWEAGRQVGVRLSVTSTGKVLRDDKRSTAEINAIFRLGDKLHALWTVRKELQDARSVAIKAGDSDTVKANDLKLESNDAAYRAAMLKAAETGVLALLPEMPAPRRPRARATDTVAPGVSRA